MLFPHLPFLSNDDSVSKNGRIEIITNEQGQRITPSWVSFSPTTSERLVGDAAKHAFHSNPSNTVFDAKRLIGREFNDKDVQKDMKSWPFEVVNQSGKPAIRVAHMNETRDFVSSISNHHPSLCLILLTLFH